jgi:hypothetical protein
VVRRKEEEESEMRPGFVMRGDSQAWRHPLTLAHLPCRNIRVEGFRVLGILGVVVEQLELFGVIE